MTPCHTYLMTNTATTAPTVHFIQSQPYVGGVFNRDTAEVATVQLIDTSGDFKHCGRYTRYSLTFTNEAQRLVSQGPIEPAAPRVFMSPQATVIASGYVECPQTIDVRGGDLIRFAGRTWKISEQRWNYPAVTLVSE